MRNRSTQGEPVVGTIFPLAGPLITGWLMDLFTDANLEDLLTEFQEKRMQMAIVIDEYGGVSGLVTVEDLVEEIVGEIHDEFDRGEPEIREISDSEYSMNAGMDIDDLTETIGVSFEGDGFDTIGGFVLHQIGKIPSAGDSVEYNGLSIEVVSTTGRRIKSLRIRKLDSPRVNDV